jgi:hypothetical protein
MLTAEISGILEPNLAVCKTRVRSEQTESRRKDHVQSRLSPRKQVDSALAHRRLGEYQ